jgi:hypothetical protein
MPLGGNRSGMDDFKFFFGGKFFLAVFPKKNYYFMTRNRRWVSLAKAAVSIRSKLQSFS